jgi:hypothetical protein
LFWRAELDPAVVTVGATPAEPGDPEAIDLGLLRALATLARSATGQEYIALSDGWRRLRLDVVDGSVGDTGWVRFDYRLAGFQHLAPRLLTLTRLVALRQDGRLAHHLYPIAAGLPRRIEALRVADALADGASYRDIALVLFGETRVRADWRTRSDYLLSRIRRRAAEARRMLAGGYKALFGGDR